MEYGLYLEAEGRVYRFPANPERYKIEHSTANARYCVLNLGEIIQPRTPSLCAISWSGIFPQQGGHAAAVGGDAPFYAPQIYIDLLVRCQTEKKPVKFIANRRMEDGSQLFDTNMQVIVENFVYEERAGETGDFYYTIQLTQWRAFTASTVMADSAPIKQRIVEKGLLTVGCAVIVNGKFWYTSAGARPFGNGNGRKARVSRILTADKVRAYPIHINDESGGALGWVTAAQLQAVDG